MKSDSRVQQGARAERRAMLDFLRRKQQTNDRVQISTAIAWLLERDTRYNRKAGGLGRK